jgi:hypothetical protein
LRGASGWRGVAVADRIEVGSNAYIERCPKCGGKHVGVVDSRPEPFGRRRKRTCRDCRHRWWTVEMPEDFARGIHGAWHQLNDLLIEVTKLRDRIPRMDDPAPLEGD